MKKIQYIFIHHTAVSYQKNPEQWKATDAYHKQKGWGGGGYNYEIAKDGSVHQFRADGAITAAQYQKSMNDGRAISICLDGNFDIEVPTAEQKKAVANLIKSKIDAYSIAKENIFCHRYVATYKSCPGKLLPDNIYNYFCAELDENLIKAQSSNVISGSVNSPKLTPAVSGPSTWKRILGFIRP